MCCANFTCSYNRFELINPQVIERFLLYNGHTVRGGDAWENGNNTRKSFCVNKGERQHENYQQNKSIFYPL